ncbi:MAG: hypothetical protein JRE64_25280 [Deltaproteobacteria bacterium]|nr:hypothetical protein [Deltaproteobacteria bacterium]
MAEFNQKAVDAIEELENTINSLDIPIILVRKLNGIRNAIESIVCVKLFWLKLKYSKNPTGAKSSMHSENAKKQ